jgi:hypothetical protein
MNAGIASPREFDGTLRPEPLFVHAPALPDAVASWEQALRWFNFGLVEIGADGRLGAEVVDTRGAVLYQLVLDARAG